MIMFILVIHPRAGLRGAENVFSPPPPPPAQSEAAFFLPEGWQVFRSAKPHSVEHIFWAFEHIVK